MKQPYVFRHLQIHYVIIPEVQESVGGKCQPEAMPLYGSLSLKGDTVPAVALDNLMTVLKFSLRGDASLVRARLESLVGEPVNGVFILNIAIVTANKQPRMQTSMKSYSGIRLS